MFRGRKPAYGKGSHWTRQELDYLAECVKKGMKLKDVVKLKFFTSRKRTENAIQVYFYRVKRELLNQSVKSDSVTEVQNEDEEDEEGKEETENESVDDSDSETGGDNMLFQITEKRKLESPVTPSSSSSKKIHSPNNEDSNYVLNSTGTLYWKFIKREQFKIFVVFPSISGLLVETWVEEGICYITTTLQVKNEVIDQISEICKMSVAKFFNTQNYEITVRAPAPIISSIVETCENKKVIIVIINYANTDLTTQKSTVKIE